MVELGLTLLGWGKGALDWLKTLPWYVLALAACAGVIFWQHRTERHLDQARLQLSRPPRALPVMKLNPAVKDIFGFRYEDFTVEGYDAHPHIPAAVAV